LHATLQHLGDIGNEKDLIFVCLESNGWCNFVCGLWFSLLGWY